MVTDKSGRRKREPTLPTNYTTDIISTQVIQSDHMPVNGPAPGKYPPTNLKDVPFDRPARVFFELRHPKLSKTTKSLISALFLGIHFL